MYFACFPEDGAGEDQTQYFDGDITLALTENLQLDVRTGFGINSDADDFFTAVDFAWRS